MTEAQKHISPEAWDASLFSYIPCSWALAKPPTQPQGASSQLSYLGAEDSKRNGNGINHLASLDPNVADHTLLPNLARGSGICGNLIQPIAGPVGSSPDLGQITGGTVCECVPVERVAEFGV